MNDIKIRYLVFILAILAISFFPKKKVFILNTSNSIPIGIYYFKETDLSLNKTVSFKQPYFLKNINRNWLVKDNLFLKTITAIPGDHVCIKNDLLTINGYFSGKVQKIDKNGLVLPRNIPSNFCRTLDWNEYWTSTNNPRSYDSRYYGPIKANDLKTIFPLWVF